MAFFSVSGAALGAKPTTLDREQIPEAYKWNLADIYTDWSAWEADLKKFETKMADMNALKGTLASGADAVLLAYKTMDELQMVAEKTYFYPGLMGTQDTRDNEVQARLQQVTILYSKFEQDTAWFTPELLAIPKDTMVGWIDSTPGLVPYRFPILEAYRQQEHVLSEDGERLLAFGSQFSDVPRQTYSMISTADVEFPSVTLADGSEIKATHGAYEVARHANRNQSDREAIFKAHFSTFNHFENTYAAIYNGVLQRDWFLARSRSYSSSAEAALDSHAIPVAVLDNLINTAKTGSAPLQRYQRIRKERLGLETYHYYDAYLPLVDVDWQIPYEEAQPLVLASVGIYGKQYQGTVQEALSSRWIDVYESEGKRSGAFSWGTYGMHPYMLLNYGDTLNDAFTLAHELGHTMHSVLSSEAQPYATHDYTIFVAEVASMTNENMLLDHLLTVTTDPAKRVVLLQHAIDDISSGFYRQAMFADFELKAHRAVEAGQPVTAETLQALYLESLHDFFGDSLDGQEEYKNTWARIPHFYNSPFYVYQYATSKAAATLEFERMTTGKKKDKAAAVETYLNLLKAGGSDHPITLLQKAGVDFSTTAPAEALVQKMDDLVSQLEVELAKLDR
ncbi:MAG: oligoendopeptidase F [Deltaproteobacteria bacterium]|nr:oligoendopeptidase F [Deltaproteobacteria bacterium]